MTQQIIDITTNNSTYTGDTPYVAFDKINDNFTDLYNGGLNADLYLGQNKASAAGRYIRMYTIGYFSSPQIQIIGSSGSTSGNDGNLDIHAGLVTAYCSVKSNGTYCRTGLNGSTAGNIYNFNWSGSTLQTYIDTSNVGTVQFTSSDKRIKQDVTYPKAEDDLALVLALSPVEFRYTEGSIFDDGARHRSLLAQDAKRESPMLTVGDDAGVEADGSINPMGLDLRALCSVLIGAVHALTARVAALESPATASGS